MFQCPNRLALTRCPPFHLPHRRRKLAPGNHACIQVAQHNKGWDDGMTWMTGMTGMTGMTMTKKCLPLSAVKTLRALPLPGACRKWNEKLHFLRFKTQLFFDARSAQRAQRAQRVRFPPRCRSSIVSQSATSPWGAGGLGLPHFATWEWRLCDGSSPHDMLELWRGFSCPTLRPQRPQLGLVGWLPTNWCWLKLIVTPTGASKDGPWESSCRRFSGVFFLKKHFQIFSV